MAVRTQLFNRPIIDQPQLTIADQVHDILCTEIHEGRWEIGDRLPGVNSLAKDAGLGVKTVQLAFERLQAEGYVKARPYSGNYLISTQPKGGDLRGRIGLLVPEESSESPLCRWYVHLLLEEAVKQGHAIDVQTAPERLAAKAVAREGGAFGPETQAVVSLVPFHVPMVATGDTPRIPVMFLVPPFESVTPRVCADVEEAYHELTSRLVLAGHRDIVFAPCPLTDPRQTAMHLAGYARAMADAGLEARSAAAACYRDSSGSIIAERMTDLLVDCRGATAIVPGSIGLAGGLLRVAPSMGIDIPGDLSLATLGSAPHSLDPGKRISGMLPDVSAMMSACFLMISDLVTVGTTQFTVMSFRLRFMTGDTARELGGGDTRTPSC